MKSCDVISLDVYRRQRAQVQNARHASPFKRHDRATLQEGVVCCPCCGSTVYGAHLAHPPGHASTRPLSESERPFMLSCLSCTWTGQLHVDHQDEIKTCPNCVINPRAACDWKASVTKERS